MKNQTARFTGNESTLRVIARTGKKGIVVQVRITTPGTKSKLGCRSVFLLAHEDEAATKFAELSEAARKAGWVEKVKAAQNAVAFTVIPTPSEAEKAEGKVAKTKKAA